jgi:hypothetical protein
MHALHQLEYLVNLPAVVQQNNPSCYSSTRLQILPPRGETMDEWSKSCNRLPIGASESDEEASACRLQQSSSSQNQRSASIHGRENMGREKPSGLAVVRVGAIAGSPSP